MGHMANISEPVSPAFIGAAPVSGDLLVRIRRGAEYVAIPVFALVVSSVLFSLFLLALGKSPVEFFELVHRGGFGTAFSIQNTLQRSAPLILTALAVAVPARIGLIMIGGEGALVLGGFSAGIVLAIVLYVLLSRTTFGFAVRITGGNPRAALAQGLPVGKLIVLCCMLAGACAGLAGFFEVAAIQGRANASLVAGYGFTGILVAFLARHNPLAIIPVAILFAGIVASGGLVQRRMDLPDATVLVLQPLTFVVLLVSETLSGPFKIFQASVSADRT